MKWRNQGQVLVLFVLSLVVLIGMAALGVDVGYMYSVRHDLQRCADTGALAGASRFINAPGETGTWNDAAVKAEATVRAIDFAKKDDVVQTQLMTQPGDNVIVTFPSLDRIRVQTERTVPLFFARLFLGPTKRITAYAVAEATSVSAHTKCLAPFGIPLPWNKGVGGTDPYKYEEGDEITELSAYMDPSTDTDGDGVGEVPYAEDDPNNPCNETGYTDVTTWDYHAHDNGVRSLRDGRLCRGTLLNLKIGEPGKAFEPGHFLALDFSSKIVPNSCPEGVDVNSGASFYKYMIMNNKCGEGCEVDVSLGDDVDKIPLKPGDMVGPTVQAVAPTYYKDPLGFIGTWPEANSLMNGDDPGGSNYTDFNYNDNSYYSGGSTLSDWDYISNQPRTNSPLLTQKRYVEIPVYDPRDPPSPGKSSIDPVAFVGVWIQDISEKQGTIIARIKSFKGTGLGSSSPGQGGEVLKTIRLVE